MTPMGWSALVLVLAKQTERARVMLVLEVILVKTCARKPRMLTKRCLTTSAFSTTPLLVKIVLATACAMHTQHFVSVTRDITAPSVRSFVP